MHDRTIRSSIDEWSPVSRRQAVLGIGTVAAGSTTLAFVSTDDAAAQVSVDGLTIPDASFAAERIDPHLDVVIGFAYDVGSEPVSDVAFSLSVDGTQIASQSLATSDAVFEGDTTLAGPITDSDAWSAEAFAPEAASSVSPSATINT